MGVWSVIFSDQFIIPEQLPCTHFAAVHQYVQDRQVGEKIPRSLLISIRQGLNKKQVDSAPGKDLLVIQIPASDGIDIGQRLPSCKFPGLGWF